MIPVESIQQVQEAVQAVKARAVAFCTNLFVPGDKLEEWRRSGTLCLETVDGAAILLRKDSDFYRLYFSAISASGLGTSLKDLDMVRTVPMVTDLIGHPDAVTPLAQEFSKPGFRNYSRLIRLSRTATSPGLPEEGSQLEVDFAAAADSIAVMQLLASCFDHYADQLPDLQEVQRALANRQILVVRDGREIAALLHFESQGFTSLLRFWAVSATYRGRRLGGALLRRYVQLDSRVRRYILWVNRTNADAIEKYKRFGYAPDGLIDDILVNHLIP